jgi:hypothetical protein
MKRLLLTMLLVFTVAASAHAKVTKPGSNAPEKNKKSPIVIHPLNTTSTTTTTTSSQKQQPDFGSGGFHSFKGSSIHK